MSQKIYHTTSSFDGYIADESHSLEWLFTVDQGNSTNDHDIFQAGVGVQVEGSSTYEWVMRETNLLAEPHKWQEFYGDKPTFVFTTRDLPRPEGADVRFVSGPVTKHLPAIMSAAGEMNVWVVGGGAPLRPRRALSDRLKLTEMEQRGQFAHLRYHVTAATAEDL